MRISDLQSKSVINVIDGKEIGNIIDISIDENGFTKELIVEKYKFIISSFSSKKEIIIKWSDVEKIGEDVIFVRVVN